MLDITIIYYVSTGIEENKIYTISNNFRIPQDYEV